MFSQRWNLLVASSEDWSRAVWYSGRWKGLAYTVNIKKYIKLLGILNRHIWKLNCSFERPSFNVTTLEGWELNLNCFLFLASVYPLLSIWSSSRQLLGKVQHLNMPGTSKVFAGSSYLKAPAQSSGKRGVLRSEKILPPTLSRNLALQGPWFALKTRDMVMMLRHTSVLPI
jgi:hypothetical protein